MHPVRLALVVAVIPSLLAAQGPSLTLQPFTLETRAHGAFPAELGTLMVPVRHADPTGPLRALRFVRLRALRTGATAPPVVYLAGGPGGSGVEAARGVRWPIFRAVQQEADIILLDQRGTGRSDPPPACTGTRAAPPTEAPLTPATFSATIRAEAARCVAQWRAQGVDLDAYTTVESAHDMESLRRALGAPTVSLWGMSYGTHLALATLRLHGASVARAVLMGTEGLDHTLKRPLAADRLLASIHAWAAADPAARTATPDLLATLRRQLARLDSAPVVVSVPAAGGQAPQRVVLGKFDLQLVVAAALARTGTASLLPVVLGYLDAGDPTWFARFAMQVRQEHLKLAAMPLAMDVASGATAARRRTVATEMEKSLLGDALNFPWPGIGEGLGITDLGDAFRAPLRSPVPVLFVSGTLDGRTPRENADEIRAGFARSRHLVLDGAGHDDDLWTSSPMVAERIAAFLAGHDVAGGTIVTPLLRIPSAGP